MQTYITVSCKKSWKIERNHGVYICYVCGALTNAMEIAFEEVTEHNPYNNPRGPVYYTFERGIEKHPVCPNRSSPWHLQIDKMLQVIFKKQKLEPSDKGTLAKAVAILKKNRAKKWQTTEDDDLELEWIEPARKPEPVIWTAVLDILHRH